MKLLQVESSMLDKGLRPSFILENQNYVNDCDMKDFRYRKLTGPKISEKEFYEQNDILKYLNKYTHNQFFTTQNKFPSYYTRDKILYNNEN